MEGKTRLEEAELRLFAPLVALCLNVIVLYLAYRTGGD